LSYAVVTPVCDDADELVRLASCMRAQTVVPARWLIVDNSREPESGALARELAAQSPWIALVREEASARPARGGQVAAVFSAGIAALEPVPDVVVKVDADVSFDSHYFEALLAEFACDPQLGMASGQRTEFVRGRWQVHVAPDGKTEAPCRAYRRGCLEDVLPFERALGWDGVDEARARALGWRTCAFPHVRFCHHRPLGARDGSRWRAWFNQGAAAHFQGYRPTYFSLRVARHMWAEPAAAAMLPGYLHAVVVGKPRCADPYARGYYASRQRLRNLPRILRTMRNRR
jgi:hypothetical protein